MNASMLSNHVFNLIFWLQLICTKKAWITTLSAKRLQLLGDFVPQTPNYFFYFSAKLNNFQKSNIQYRFVHEYGQLNMFSNHACCCLFQTFASNMHQNEWFQVRFFKNFLGRGSPSPLPRPLPRFFSGFALGSGFALNFQALRAFDSGFALDSWKCRKLRGHVRPSVGIVGGGLNPPRSFFNPPHVSDPLGGQANPPHFQDPTSIYLLYKWVTKS